MVFKNQGVKSCTIFKLGIKLDFSLYTYILLSMFFMSTSVRSQQEQKSTLGI